MPRPAWNEQATAKLWEAVSSGDESSAYIALAAGANPNALHPDDDSPPLTTACYMGHIGLVKVLMSAEGVRSNHPRPADGKTALHIAVEEGHEDVVKLLLALAPPPPSSLSSAKAPAPCPIHLVTDMDDWLPLHWAAYYGDDHLAVLLLQSGQAQKQVMAANCNGQLPLDVALEMCGSRWAETHRNSCYGRLLEVLDNHGANVTAWRSRITSGTALHEAVQQGSDSGTLEALARLGVLLHARTDASCGAVTALHIAIAAGYTHLAATLLQAEAAATTAANITLDISLKDEHQSHAFLVNMCEGDLGLTPLMMALQQGNVDLVKLLLKHQADASVRDCNNLAAPAHALISASSEGSALSLLELIINRLGQQGRQEDYLQNSNSITIGADASQPRAPTALHVACSKGWLHTAQLLLSQPPHVQQLTGHIRSLDASGHTPLHMAVIKAAVIAKQNDATEIASAAVISARLDLAMKLVEAEASAFKDGFNSPLLQYRMCN